MKLVRWNHVAVNLAVAIVVAAVETDDQAVVVLVVDAADAETTKINFLADSKKDGSFASVLFYLK